MNRQTRRHPTHPLLPLFYPSKTRITEKKRKKASVTSKKNNKLFKRKLI